MVQLENKSFVLTNIRQLLVRRKVDLHLRYGLSPLLETILTSPTGWCCFSHVTLDAINDPLHWHLKNYNRIRGRRLRGQIDFLACATGDFRSENFHLVIIRFAIHAS